jgi:cation diffusion facilitator family transporter
MESLAPRSKLSLFIESGLSFPATRILSFVCIVLSIIIFFYFAIGLWINSSALLAAGFHMVFHFGVLGTSLWSLVTSTSNKGRSSSRPFAYSYGFERYEVLSSFSNTLTLIFTCIFVMAGALGRLTNSSELERISNEGKDGGRLLLGAVGVVFYILYPALIGAGHSSYEEMLRYQSQSSTFIHTQTNNANGIGGKNTISAATLSVGGTSLPSPISTRQSSIKSGISLIPYMDALPAGLVLLLSLMKGSFRYATLDAFAALVISAFTLSIAGPLFVTSGMILLQTTPTTLRVALERCRREALTVDGVCDILDERWWTQSPGYTVGSLTVRARSDASEREIITRLQRSYGKHVSDLTIQVEKDLSLSYILNEGVQSSTWSARDTSNIEDNHGAAISIKDLS